LCYISFAGVRCRGEDIERDRKRERERERERERREREREKRPNFEILETADLSNPIVLRSGSKLAIPLLSLLLEGDVYASKQNNFEMTNST
jgi:hypothetical protein